MSRRKIGRSKKAHYRPEEQCHKYRYADKASAKLAMHHNLRFKHGLRIYRCNRCHGWHLTHLTLAQGEASIGVKA